MIRRAHHAVGEQAGQLAMLAGLVCHEIARFPGAWRAQPVRGEQKTRDLGNSRITRQLQQIQVEDHVGTQITENVPASGRPHGVVSQLPDECKLLI